MISTVQKTVAARFPQIRGKRVLVAASGGADSTALALALQDLGCEIALAHVHHGIRGKSADADARFVAALAKKLGAPVFFGKFAVPAEAKKTGESLEMAARRVRRDFLVATAKRGKFRFVAVGQTADDQAETVLMRIARGTSVAGLAGIPYLLKHRGVAFVRPLRDVPRAQVVAFLTSRRQRWREDETNADDFALRNRVRHEILPLLEQRLNPGVRQALLRLADIAAAEDQVMSALARKTKLTARTPLALRRRLALDELRAAGVPPEKRDFRAVENPRKVFTFHVKPAESFYVLRKNPAQAPQGRATLAARAPHGRATLAARAPQGRSTLVARDPHGLAPWVNEFAFASPKSGKTRSPTPRGGGGPEIEIRRGRGFSRRADEVCLSAAAVGDRDLVFRSWRPGDRMKPLGMAGSKKLSDVFTDLKIPRAERPSWIVVECAGQIAALAGWRVSRDFAVESPRAPSLRIRNLSGSALKS
ncbi:MAG: tRNA lysidine(34) synthetase TilS [Spartobacteria bacterium]|nr:tRNA lysidine(34) synthetase TilS [Spartobacteria bacterium]